MASGGDFGEIEAHLVILAAAERRDRDVVEERPVARACRREDRIRHPVDTRRRLAAGIGVVTQGGQAQIRAAIARLVAGPDRTAIRRRDLRAAGVDPVDDRAAGADFKVERRVGRLVDVGRVRAIGNRTRHERHADLHTVGPTALRRGNLVARHATSKTHEGDPGIACLDPVHRECQVVVAKGGRIYAAGIAQRHLHEDRIDRVRRIVERQRRLGCVPVQGRHRVREDLDGVDDRVVPAVDQIMEEADVQLAIRHLDLVAQDPQIAATAWKRRIEVIQHAFGLALDADVEDPSARKLVRGGQLGQVEVHDVVAIADQIRHRDGIGERAVGGAGGTENRLRNMRRQVRRVAPEALAVAAVVAGPGRRDHVGAVGIVVAVGKPVRPAIGGCDLAAPSVDPKERLRHAAILVDIRHHDRHELGHLVAAVRGDHLDIIDVVCARIARSFEVGRCDEAERAGGRIDGEEAAIGAGSADRVGNRRGAAVLGGDNRRHHGLVLGHRRAGRAIDSQPLLRIEHGDSDVLQRLGDTVAGFDRDLVDIVLIGIARGFEIGRGHEGEHAGIGIDAQLVHVGAADDGVAHHRAFGIGGVDIAGNHRVFEYLLGSGAFELRLRVGDGIEDHLVEAQMLPGVAGAAEHQPGAIGDLDTTQRDRGQVGRLQRVALPGKHLVHGEAADQCLRAIRQLQQHIDLGRAVILVEVADLQIIGPGHDPEAREAGRDHALLPCADLDHRAPGGRGGEFGPEVHEVGIGLGQPGEILDLDQDRLGQGDFIDLQHEAGGGFGLRRVGGEDGDRVVAVLLRGAADRSGDRIDGKTGGQALGAVGERVVRVDIGEQPRRQGHVERLVQRGRGVGNAARDDRRVVDVLDRQVELADRGIALGIGRGDLDRVDAHMLVAGRADQQPARQAEEVRQPLEGEGQLVIGRVRILEGQADLERHVLRGGDVGQRVADDMGRLGVAARPAALHQLDVREAHDRALRGVVVVDQRQVVEGPAGMRRQRDLVAHGLAHGGVVVAHRLVELGDVDRAEHLEQQVVGGLVVVVVLEADADEFGGAVLHRHVETQHRVGVDGEGAAGQQGLLPGVAAQRDAGAVGVDLEPLRRLVLAAVAQERVGVEVDREDDRRRGRYVVGRDGHGGGAATRGDNRVVAGVRDPGDRYGEAFRRLFQIVIDDRHGRAGRGLACRDDHRGGGEWPTIRRRRADIGQRQGDGDRLAQVPHPGHGDHGVLALNGTAGRNRDGRRQVRGHGIIDHDRRIARLSARAVDLHGDGAVGDQNVVADEGMPVGAPACDEGVVIIADQRAVDGEIADTSARRRMEQLGKMQLDHV
ncbi:hypothetical protein LOS8367_03724 [Limimaricola soesokkakensis]|uniref:Uncharacterized protein n=1 Tax=Limimaricola soesokkakensis TaxID=1343159 RepID=A0A1X7A834_9RHOB|nr:hypothetical protein LOS8367_03724 [Limimaricola soesokkakensis]